MTGAFTIRDAAPEDAPAMARIYNEGIEDRLATLETELRTPEERAAWLEKREPRHPVIVALDAQGALVGWGSLNLFNPRPVYRFVADFSIYVARARRGEGIGHALLEALEIRARELGYHKMVLAGFAANDAAMALYARHGFSRVGAYREQGKVDGAWVDVTIMEKILEDAP